MVGPSSRISKILLALLFGLLIFFIVTDFQLYFRVQNYPIERNFHINSSVENSNLLPPPTVYHQSPPQLNVENAKVYGEDTWIPCDINPLCHVTVKALLLDHTNHYVFAPLATIFDNVLGISKSAFITANMISFFHVGVACIAGKLISSDNLGYRRLGVVMFQFRTFLDDLDGHVARVKKNIRGERSEVGTTGYYVDGICDGIGCIALLIGIFFYLKNNPPRRGYVQLPISETKFAEPVNRPKMKYTTKKIAKKVISFTGELLLSSTAWNRYIAVYQDMLERNDITGTQFIQQNLIFKSKWFFCIAWLWRIVNVHALLHYVLLSIFCDKLWDFLKAVQYSGYLILLVIICATEMHALEAHNFIFKSYLYEAGWHLKGLIGVTEPRSSIIETLAERVAYERGEQTGTTVGYATEFSESLSKKTEIKYMSEMVFLSELLHDPLLTKYSILVIDDAHERKVTTDIMLTLLKKVCKQRNCLKLIIMSCSTDVQPIAEFFDSKLTKNMENIGSCKVLFIENAINPVKIHYLGEPCSDYVDETVQTIIKIHSQSAPGHIMAFLTSQLEVTEAFNLLKEYVATEGLRNLHIFPLYGSLSIFEQSRVFERLPKGRRKVILVTNVAEVVMTIPGVTYVIDCGFVKIKWFEAKSMSNSLVIVPISKAIAMQRSGRAGLTWPGKVYRLYTETEYEHFVDRITPEMRRGDLTFVVLLLKALGIRNIMQFEFISPPSVKNLKMVLELLYAIGAIDELSNLTKPIGYLLAEVPFSPLLSKMVLASDTMGCSEEILTIMALLHVQTIFSQKNSVTAQTDGAIAKRCFEVAEGDLITLLNVYKAFVENEESKEFCGRYHLIYRNLKRAVELRSQLCKMVKRKFGITKLKSANGNVEIVCKCITAGFFLNAAYLHHSGVYRKINSGEKLKISPTSALYTQPQPQYVIYCNALKTDCMYIENVTVIKEQWLKELAPHYYF